MTLPICEKLLRSGYLTGAYYGLVNPDGPEAADLIETLVEAIEKARNTLAVCATGHPSFVICDDALAKARGENIPGSEEIK